MQSRCRKKPLLYTLLATATLSVSLCLLTLAILTGEEDDPRMVEPGQRPIVLVRHVGANNQREILHVGNDGAQGGRNKREEIEGLKAISMEVSPTSEGVASQAAQGVRRQDGNCTGPWPGFPSCQEKMEWMADNWRKDACYADNGVDGSKCSFQMYLSEMEHHCPPLTSQHSDTTQLVKATPRYEIDSLMDQLSKNMKFDWLQRRITTHWPHWTAALRSFEDHTPLNHTRKNVLIHIGALSDKAKFMFAENADHGGPLGELVQWSDLIASIYILGHSIDFSTELNQLRHILESRKGNGWCPVRSDMQYHVIYIDIVGLKQFKKLVKGKIQHYQCLFRVLDSFGTEPQFNFKSWKPPNRNRGDYGQAWGNWNFNPRQFLTMYPHTPDNSFLGFVVGSKMKNANVPVKKNIALVYGKELYMWEGKRKYLDIISRYLDIHATVGTTQPKKDRVDPAAVIPGYVTNHGIMNSTDLHTLLSQTKVFIGMGFPYEGPAPLEAIASGCVFLNPELSPPLNRYNSKFLKGKPTLRSLTSQNPYTENFIGQPYVFTFDMTDSQSVIEVMESITKMDALPGYLPYEFTYEGVLERVLVYLQNQDFCSAAHQWPDRQSLVIKISKEDESCKDACYREGLVCEPELFPFLNKESAVKEHFRCSFNNVEHSVHGPSYNSRTHGCSIQATHLLYSCVGSESKVQRLCPCRTYRKGQVALCSTCTS